MNITEDDYNRMVKRLIQKVIRKFTEQVIETVESAIDRKLLVFEQKIIDKLTAIEQNGQLMLSRSKPLLAIQGNDQSHPPHLLEQQIHPAKELDESFNTSSHDTSHDNSQG